MKLVLHLCCVSKEPVAERVVLNLAVLHRSGINTDRSSIPDRLLILLEPLVLPRRLPTITSQPLLLPFLTLDLLRLFLLSGFGLQFHNLLLERFDRCLCGLLFDAFRLCLALFGIAAALHAGRHYCRRKVVVGGI